MDLARVESARRVIGAVRRVREGAGPPGIFVILEAKG
jgi:hypothetical protein